MSIFPGNKITENKTEIMFRVVAQINLDKDIITGEGEKWERVDDVNCISRILSDSESYYLLYKHPVHEYLDQLYLSKGDELISFIYDRIKPDRLEGLDITIASEDFILLVVCNHDGEIYMRI